MPDQVDQNKTLRQFISPLVSRSLLTPSTKPTNFLREVYQRAGVATENSVNASEETDFYGSLAL